MDYQTIIETFFSMLGRFDFDRAKTYIDGRKDVLQRLAPTFPNQLQLMTMLTTFSHLAEVEKNYHNQPYLNQKEHHSHHSFLPTTNFLRKPKSLKDMYHEIYTELQLLEQIETNKRATNINISVAKCLNDDNPPRIINSATSSPLPNVTSRGGDCILPQLPKLVNKQQSTDNATGSGGDQHLSNSSSTEKDSPVTQAPQSPGSALKNSFFRVLSPISSSATQANRQSGSQQQTPTYSLSSANGDPYSMSSSSGYEPPPNSSTTTPINGLNVREFTEELILHFCRQLQNFVQARLDLIDVYDKLVEASSKKYVSVDGVAFKLSMLCRQYRKCFHHPLLAPIKEGMTLECESLMNLIKATIDMQHWRFLPTLYDLNDAQSKLSYWAASTFSKEATRRRFKVSKAQAPPRLYEWLCRYKDFLIAKFTLYFHTTLTRNFPPTNVKSACLKLSADYYAKLANFQRKIDALLVALLYDVSNEKDFLGSGYLFPSKDFQRPQGKHSLQPMVIVPAESRTKLNNSLADIYMITVSNGPTMVKEGQYQFHDNKKKLTYSISKPDPNVVLVIVCEGQKIDRDASVRTFSAEFTNQLAFLNIFNN